MTSRPVLWRPAAVAVVLAILFVHPIRSATGGSAPQRAGDAHASAAEKTVSAPPQASILDNRVVARVLRRDAAEIRREVTKDGATVLHTGGSFGHVIAIAARPDGSTEIVCLTTEREAERFFPRKPAQPAGTTEKRQ
ncbi:MAG: hypothetical protein ACXV5L_04700 [Thermoanaerobaculia bacterium]